MILAPCLFSSLAVSPAEYEYQSPRLTQSTPPDAYSAYQTATGATVDETTGLLTVTKDQYDTLENISFYIGGEGFILTPNAQIWPVCFDSYTHVHTLLLTQYLQRSLNTAIGGSPGNIYLVIASIGVPSGQGFDFMMGQTFLERFYSYYGEC